MIIDVSHNQGKIQWTKVLNAGVDSVYIKVSQGTTFIDPMMMVNAFAAEAAGLKIGYYHFGTLNGNNVEIDATNEANFFLSLIRKAPKATLPLVLDIETNNNKVSPQNVLLFINTFFKILSTNGKTDVLLYSYTPFLDENLPSSHSLEGIRTWIAAYGGHYHIPKGWQNIYMWQYDDKGKIDGISTIVDLNKLI